MHQVSKDWICALITKEEKSISSQFLYFWQLLKCEPELWNWPENGQIWVAGFLGKKAIW